MTSTGLRAKILRRSRTSSSALALYCLVAFLYFGLRLLVEPGSQYVGYGTDPQLFAWSFAWWPHAILHGQNPFFTHAIWAPTGVNLTWATSVPGLALIFSPLTLLFGPIASYNVAATLIPALDAWAGFLLCRHLTRSFWPSLLGGYLFGFSAYVLGQEEGHPHMTAVFLVPLVALVLLRYVEGGLSGRGLLTRLAPLLVLQVLISTELAFTLGLAVVAGLALAAIVLPDRRRRIASLVPPLAFASVLAAVMLAPFAYYAVTGYQSESVNPPRFYTADLLNFVVPTRLALVSLGWAAPIAHNFPANDSERDAYLGLPALLIVGLHARRRRSRETVLLLAALVLAGLASLGERLTVSRWHHALWLPWSLVVHAPFFDNVLPVRLALFAALVVAVVAALWTAGPSAAWLRLGLAALAVVALLPNPASGAWATTYTIPDFFTSPAYRHCLGRDETILPLPISGTGLEMLWQAEDDFRFRMAGGGIAPNPPASFVTSPAVALVASSKPVPPSQAGVLREFIRAKGVTSVVVAQDDAGQWSLAMNTIAKPQYVGGVILYHVATKPVRSC